MARLILYWLICTCLVIGAAIAVSPAAAELRSSGSVHELPSLTGWGKIFSLLLLAALGVAYLVWRKPIVEAKAILETSPLGTAQPSAALVDWRLFLKVLIVLEILALGIVWITSRFIRPLSELDVLGILTSACIIAFVVHLLMLARRGGHR